MKTILVLAAMVSLGLSACKRCQTCNVMDVTKNTQVYTYGEECGKKKELESSKQACEDNYDTSTYDCVCTEN